MINYDTPFTFTSYHCFTLALYRASISTLSNVRLYSWRSLIWYCKIFFLCNHISMLKHSSMLFMLLSLWYHRVFHTIQHHTKNEISRGRLLDSRLALAFHIIETTDFNPNFKIIRNNPMKIYANGNKGCFNLNKDLLKTVNLAIQPFIACMIACTFRMLI